MNRALQSRERDDSGMSLIELLVAMVILLAIMGAFFTLFIMLSNASTNARNLTGSQESTRNILRIMESDLRSADPLTLVPSSFTLDPSGSSSAGTNGTSATDIVAMYSAQDAYTSCPTQSSTTTSTTVPTSFAAGAFGANLIWAYNPTIGVLTRYTYCADPTTPANSAWVGGVSLRNVVSKTKTMFSVAQIGTARAQATTPTPTTVTNQGAPACGTSISVLISTRPSVRNTAAFTVKASIDLPNQPATANQACG